MNAKTETIYEIRRLPNGERHLRLPDTRYVLVWKNNDLNTAYVGRISAGKLTDVTIEAKTTGIYEYLMTIAENIIKHAEKKGTPQ